MAYKLKQTAAVDIGHTAAQQQFVVREYDCKAGFGLAVSEPVEVIAWERGTRLQARRGRCSSRATGFWLPIRSTAVS
ncbi:MAG: hypothetical protein ACLRMJ_05575 [Alistipes finegoldii]